MSPRTFLLLLVMLPLHGVAQPALRQGDILFEDIDCGPLCEAIRKVTEGHGGRDFAHCALVVQSADTLAVVEAIGQRVQMNGVGTFMARATQKKGVLVYAVGRMTDSTLAQAAAAFAKARVGEPYDDPFMPDNGRWYCSELIQVAYRHANGGIEVFPSAPMTFKDPATGQYFPVWVEYYRDIGFAIPEGIPGINPGLMSRSGRLRILGD
jgi:uncharacterized protein YycO